MISCAWQSDVESFALPEPSVHGFRHCFAAGNSRFPAETLVEMARLLTLAIAKMAVLASRMRAMGSHAGGAVGTAMSGRHFVPRTGRLTYYSAPTGTCPDGWGRQGS